MCAELNNFIKQQQVEWTDDFQMPLLLKAVLRYMAFLKTHHTNYGSMGDRNISERHNS